MTAETLGRWSGQVYRSKGVRRLLVILILIVAVPPIFRYWMERIPLERLPSFSVPIETSIALIAGAIFLTAFGMVTYVVLYSLRQMTQIERQVQIVQAQKRKAAAEATEGSFTPMTDDKAWATEQMDLLTRQGILTQTDRTEIEELAKEMGMEAAMRAKVNKR